MAERLVVTQEDGGSKPSLPAMKICKYETCNNEVVQAPGGHARRLFCNEKCTRKQAVADKRRRLKLQAMDYLGGECIRCGWNEHPAGLVPHHVDPSEKEFSIGSGATKAWAKIEMELDKCYLLCQNCHATIHATRDPNWVVIPS